MKNLWIIGCLLLAFSCGRPAVTGFEATKWEPVDPMVDSITILLEQSFYDVAPAESIAASIDRLYPHDRLLQTRAHANASHAGTIGSRPCSVRWP